jgi:HEAT repeat protein
MHPSDPSSFAQALDATDAEERRQATSRLPELVLADALPLLRRALGDADWRVRKEATIAARAFVPAPALIDGLLSALEPGDNVGLRNAVVEVLAGCGSAVTAPLAASLRRLDADGRKLAAEVLGRTRDPLALVLLENALVDPDPNVRQAAVEGIAALGPIAPESVGRILLHCLDDQDILLRLAALEGLNGLGMAVTLERLEPLMDHPMLRPAAVAATAHTDDPRAAPVLARVLASNRGGAFVQALSALAHLAEGPLAAAVSVALKAQGSELAGRLVRVAAGEGNEPDAQRHMALILGAMAQAPGSVDAAVEALAEETLAEPAERALMLLGEQALKKLIVLIQAPVESPAIEPDVRAALIEIASNIALAAQEEPQSEEQRSWPGLLAAFRTAARDSDRRVATSALFALSRFGTASDLVLAADLILSPVASIALSAEGTLAALASRNLDKAHAFAERMLQADPFSLAAAILLGSLGAARHLLPSSAGGAVAALARVASTAADPRTRRAAVTAVTELGGPAAMDVLGFALADEEREVRLAAARALGHLCAGIASRRWAIGDPGESIAERARSILDLVARSTDPDLLAAAVRALGDGLASWTATPLSMSPTNIYASEALIGALAPLTRDARSSVAIAALEALGRAPSAGLNRIAALSGALEHPDVAVVKAAMLKLEATAAGSLGPVLRPPGDPTSWNAHILRCIEHPSTEVRLLAVEMLSGTDSPLVRQRFIERVAVESDRAVRDAIETALAAMRRPRSR